MIHGKNRERPDFQSSATIRGTYITTRNTSDVWCSSPTILTCPRWSLPTFIKNVGRSNYSSNGSSKTCASNGFSASLKTPFGAKSGLPSAPICSWQSSENGSKSTARWPKFYTFLRWSNLKIYLYLRYLTKIQTSKSPLIPPKALFYRVFNGTVVLQHYKFVHSSLFHRRSNSIRVLFQGKADNPQDDVSENRSF